MRVHIIILITLNLTRLSTFSRMKANLCSYPRDLQNISCLKLAAPASKEVAWYCFDLTGKRTCWSLGQKTSNKIRTEHFLLTWNNWFQIQNDCFELESSSIQQPKSAVVHTRSLPKICQFKELLDTMQIAILSQQQSKIGVLPALRS